MSASQETPKQETQEETQTQTEKEKKEIDFLIEDFINRVCLLEEVDSIIRTYRGVFPELFFNSLRTTGKIKVSSSEPLLDVLKYLFDKDHPIWKRIHVFKVKF